MDPEQIKLDKNGIPVLENIVSADELGSDAAPPPADLTDHEQIGELLREETIQRVLDDITEDLQKLAAKMAMSFEILILKNKSMQIQIIPEPRRISAEGSSSRVSLGGT